MAASAESARYVFTVRFRLEPTTTDVTVSPATFETTLFRHADPPGEPGWRFFRDNLWHGELADESHFRTLTEDALGVPVESVSFSELRTSPAYLDALEAAVGENLSAFKADTIEQALAKYLGSSIHVRDDASA